MKQFILMLLALSTSLSALPDSPIVPRSKTQVDDPVQTAVKSLNACRETAELMMRATTAKIPAHEKKTLLAMVRNESVDVQTRLGWIYEAEQREVRRQQLMRSIANQVVQHIEEDTSHWGLFKKMVSDFVNNSSLPNLLD